MNRINNTYFNYIRELSDGLYTADFYCNDSFGNIGHSSVAFAIDTHPPVISLDSMLTHIYINYSNSIYFNYTAFTLGGEPLDTCEFWGNWGGGWHLNQTNKTAVIDSIPNSFLLSKLLDGTYKWNVWCNNINNVSDWSGQGNQTFTVDTIAPSNVKFVPPTVDSGKTINENDLKINVSAFDINLANFTINIYDTHYALFDLKTSSTIPPSSFYYEFKDLPDGLYFFNATACDRAGNCNNTETRHVLIDTVAIPPTPPGGDGGGGGGGGVPEKERISMKIVVPSISAISKTGKNKFNFHLENDGNVNFNDITIDGYLLGDSTLLDSPVTFDPNFIKLLESGKKENIFVTVSIDDPTILIYEVVINATSKTPAYNVYNKIFITFLGKNTTIVQKIIVFTEGLINENAECIELKDMLDDAKKALAEGNVEEAGEIARAAMEACKRTIEGLERPQAGKPKEDNTVRYIIIAMILAIVLGFLFNIYRQIRFRGWKNFFHRD
jgi:hypothetical protein